MQFYISKLLLPSKVLLMGCAYEDMHLSPEDTWPVLQTLGYIRTRAMQKDRQHLWVLPGASGVASAC